MFHDPGAGDLLPGKLRPRGDLSEGSREICEARFDFGVALKEGLPLFLRDLGEGLAEKLSKRGDPAGLRTTHSSPHAARKGAALFASLSLSVVPPPSPFLLRLPLPPSASLSSLFPSKAVRTSKGTSASGTGSKRPLGRSHRKKARSSFGPHRFLSRATAAQDSRPPRISTIMG